MAVCDLHRFHSPRPRTTEDHHVVPQAWQRVWVPPSYDDMDAPRLWNDSTVSCCPTGHRNVHVWIVRIMRAFQREQDLTRAEAVARKELGRANEEAVARLAPRLFVEAGGDLNYLISKRQYGYGIPLHPATWMPWEPTP